MLVCVNSGNAVFHIRPSLRRPSTTTTVATSMSSLADELLNDLEDTVEEEEEQEEQAAGSSGLGTSLKRKAEEDAEMDEDDEDDEEHPTIDGGVAPGGIAPAQGEGVSLSQSLTLADSHAWTELDAEDVEQMDLAEVDDVRNVAKLEGSKRMMDVLNVREPSFLAAAITLIGINIGLG